MKSRSLTEAIDSNTVGGEVVFHVFAAVTQIERLMKADATAPTAARARGRTGGRLPG